MVAAAMFSNSNAINPLNLFPATSGAPAAQAKLTKLLCTTTNRTPTEIQRTLASKLFDDSFEYMTTLDMNRAASFTFGYQNSYGVDGTTSNDTSGGTHGESIANQLWEFLIDSILIRSTHHSVLALTKTLYLIQHVLLHGSESSVMNVDLLYRIEMAVNPLRTLNTAMVEQQIVEGILNGEKTGLESDGMFQFSSLSVKATATMLKLRGGSVDKGDPVRTASTNLFNMVSTTDNLKRLRMEQATSHSLVPVGTSKQVGFITDEARYRLLEQKMRQEESLQKQQKFQEERKMKTTKSNLAGVSASDGFGGGFTSGSQVVGAAHSLEDMIKSARYELQEHKLKQEHKISSMKKGYSDDPYTRAQQVAEVERCSNWQNDPKMIQKEKALRDALEYLEEMQKEQLAQNSNFLDGEFASNTKNSIPKTDLFNTGDTDLLGFDNAPNSSPGEDLLGFDLYAAPAPVIASDPFNQANVSNLSSMTPAMSTNSIPEVRTSLVTGNLSQHDIMLNKQQNELIGMESKTNDNITTSWQREEIEAERSRKQDLAMGLFAGVVPSAPAPSTVSNAITSCLPAPNEMPATPIDIFDQIDETALQNTIQPTGFHTSPEEPVDFSFATTPMGGNFGEGVALPPSTAPPPPPPSMAPPPPPPPIPSVNTSSMPTSFDPTNLDKDQMMQMMIQQQAQMQKMMNMMSSMGMNMNSPTTQGNQQQQQQNQFNYQGSNTSNGGGWPPTS